MNIVQWLHCIVLQPLCVFGIYIYRTKMNLKKKEPNWLIEVLSLLCVYICLPVTVFFSLGICSVCKTNAVESCLSVGHCWRYRYSINVSADFHSIVILFVPFLPFKNVYFLFINFMGNGEWKKWVVFYWYYGRVYSYVVLFFAAFCHCHSATIPYGKKKRKTFYGILGWENATQLTAIKCDEILCAIYSMHFAFQSNIK